MSNRATKAVSARYFALLVRELRFIFRDKVLFFALFCYPLVIVFFFTSLLSQGTIQEVPISIVDLDRSVASRSLTQDIEAAPALSIKRRDISLYDAKQAMLSGDIYGIVLIPNEFEKKLLGSLSPEVAAFYNNQYMSLGSSLQRGFGETLMAVISQYQTETMMAQGFARAIAAEQLSPLKVEVHSIFNPTLNYNYTLTNGIVPTLLQILIMMTMVFSMTRDKYKSGGIAVPIAMANGSFVRYLVNKIMPYLVWFLVAHVLLDTVLVIFYDLPIRGSLFVLYLGTALFIVVAQLWAIFFALWLPKKVLNYGAASSFSSPAFGFVGLFFPRIAMSWFAYAWGALLPVTWFVEIRLDQTIRGHEFPYNLEPHLWLAILGIVMFLLVIIRMQMLSKGAKHV